jgi:hypothetical protein
VGAVPAEGNDEQAGVGSLAAFDATFKGNLLIAQAGDATFAVYSDAGFLFGGGGGSTPEKTRQ